MVESLRNFGLGRNLRNPDETVVLPDLEPIVARQVDRFVKLGFYTEVYPNLQWDRAEYEYRKDFSLPNGAAQPNAYIDRFDVALVIEPRISLTRQHELAKKIKGSRARRWKTSQVTEWIFSESVTNLTKFPQDRPYLVFTHYGQKYRDYPVEKTLTLFDGDEVGSPQIEVTGLYLQYPEYFVNYCIFAAGSRLGDSARLVPYLDTLDNKPYFNAGPIDGLSRSGGALTRGRDYILLGA